MRLHITLDTALVRDLDRRVGARGRSSFVARAVARALEDEHRWELIQSSLGTIPERGHGWDDDAGRWVREQRRLDVKRVG